MKVKNSYNEKGMLFEVARLYYEENLTQDQIAKRCSLSRQKVQRLLQKARTEGIVQIHLVNPYATNEHLEGEIEKIFNLQRAIVVPGGVQSEEIIRRNIGRAAASYLRDVIRDNDVLGLGWGRTVYEVINCLDTQLRVSITVVPLIGGVGQMAAHFQVNELAKKAAELIRGTFVPFYAPALVRDETIVKALFSDSKISEAVKLWERVDIAIVGIGGKLSNLSYTPVSYFSEQEITLLNEKDHVGDILSHFFDRDGKICSPSLSEKVVGISFKQLKKIKRVIGVGGSLRKWEAIRGALKGKYINILVTDEYVARELLKSSNKLVE